MKKQKSYLETIAKIICESTHVIGHPLSKQESERLSILINQSMTTRSRFYHGPKHVLSVARNTPPIGKLASFFHDIVYIQVDGSTHSEITKLLKPFQIQANLSLTIPDENSPLFQILLDIFGFQKSQTITLKDGLNEFLSAWVAGQSFSALPLKEITQIFCIIESTIPFRGHNGIHSPLSFLKERLKNTNKKHSLQFSEKEINKTIQICVQVSNQDVESFSDKDPRKFLDDSWKVLLETNPMLQKNFYSIKNYRDAIYSLEKFYHFLKPSLIFQRFENVPPKKTYENQLKQAQENLELGKIYMGAKLIEISLMDAIATLTGGDCPMEIFFGDYPKNKDEFPDRLEYYLKIFPSIKPQTGLKKNVIKVLEKGRKSWSGAKRKPPLSAMILKQLSDQNFDKTLIITKSYINAEITAEEYLNQMPTKIYKNVIEACKKFIWTRKEKISKLYPLNDSKKFPKAA